MTGGCDKGSYFIPQKIPQCFCISKFYYIFSGKLKHVNFNFGFSQKPNYTKTNTKSLHDCYSVSSSYLLRHLYRKIFIMTSTACLVLSTFFACYCTETSLCNRPRGIRLFTMFLCNWYLKRWTDNVMLLIFSRDLLHKQKWDHNWLDLLALAGTQQHWLPVWV